MTEGPVNAIPEGLLDLLAVKQTGRYPDTLSDRYVAVLDPFELFILPRIQYAQETGLTLTGVLTTLSVLAVPAGEVWWVKSFQVIGTLGAGVTAKFRCFAGIPNAAANSSDDSECDNGSSGTVGERIRATKRNFWAMSGWVFGAQAIQNVGGPITPVTYNWNYVPFKR